MNRLLILGATLLAACGNVGPRTSAILNDEAAVTVPRDLDAPYALVEVDTPVAELASHLVQAGMASSFIPDSGAGPVIIGSGDIVQISIVVTNEGGFIDFQNSAMTPISTTMLPEQEVGSDGSVSVPPLGRLRAAGNTVQAFERLLERRLGEELVDPSAVVRLVERRSARVSVVGQVASPGTFPIGQTNQRLVEMIAQAGGATGPAEDLMVSMSRGSRTGEARLDAVYETPRLNVVVRPGDVISIEPPQNRITLLGANGANAIVRYDEPTLSLAEALGRGGGLQNRRADPRGVFVYRELRHEEAARFGVDMRPFPGPTVPTIFNIDLTEPQSLFAAKTFQMAEGDLVYVADSRNEEISAIFDTFTIFAPTPGDYVRDATID